MSIKLITVVWDKANVDGARLLILLALADFANDDGYCWPSVAALAHKARVSERWVQYTLRELAEIKVLEVVKEGGGRAKLTSYRIVADRLSSPFPGKGAKGALCAERVHSVTEKGALCDTPSKGRARGTVIEPSLEPSEQQQRARIFEVYEKALGKPLTNRIVADALLQDEADFGPVCVEHSLVKMAKAGALNYEYAQAIMQRHQVEGCNERTAKARPERNGRTAAEIEADPANLAAAQRYIDGE